MKSLIIALSMLSLFGFFNSTAQSLNKNLRLKKIKFAEIQIGVDENFNKNILFPFSDFKSLAPQSALLNSDFNGYTSSNSYSNNRIGRNNSYPSLMFGLQFRDKQKLFYKSNPMLRFGISYTQDINIYTIFSKQESYPYDTLISTQTGQQYFIDSVSSKNYDMDYVFDQLKFDCSIIYRTNPAAAVSFYSGLGLNYGFSTYAFTDIIYGDSYTLTTSPTYYGSNNNEQYEDFKNKNNSEFTAYIPVGIEFNFFHKRELLKLIHIFYEGRAGYNFISIPETKTLQYFSIMNCFGIKLSF